MSRKPLSNVDYAWLRMDDPANLMIINAVMIFDGPLDIERLKATIEHSLLKFKRFRQRVVFSRLPFIRPIWQDDPHFNLDDHVERVVLPLPGDQKVLQDLISLMMGQELDYSRPLWQFYLVESYDGGSALICRLHHSIADGIALMHVLLSATESDPDAPWPTHVPEHKPQSRPGFRERRRRRMQRTRKRAQQIANMLIQEGSKVVNDPDTARRYAHFAAQLPLAVARLALRWPDPPTLYKGPLGIEKRVAWSDPIPLVDIKMIGKTFEGTVNDVLLSIVTGALRRYLQDRGEMVEGADIRGVVPVNLRPIELDDELGNQFGLVFLDLPISTGDPLLRLIKLKKSMDNLKSTPEAVASYGILNVFGVLPLGLQRFGVSIFDTKGTAVMTNVPGPQEQLYFAGAPLRSVMAWVPQSGRLGLGVSILSYNGQVWLGLATDKGLVPDPERIIDFFTQKFQEMKSLAQRSKEKRSEPIEPMFTRLDKALDTLDELLAESEQTNSGNGGPTPGRCRATTKSGRQCKNLPLTGEQYCRVHIP